MLKRSKKKIITIFSVFLIISLVTGIIGLILTDGSGYGFLIGFFAPLIISIVALWIWEEYIEG